MPDKESDVGFRRGRELAKSLGTRTEIQTIDHFDLAQGRDRMDCHEGTGHRPPQVQRILAIARGFADLFPNLL